MTADSTQLHSTRRSSRLANKTSQRAPTSTQRAPSPEPRPLKPKKPRGKAGEKKQVARGRTVANAKRPSEDKGKGKGIEEIPPVTTLDATATKNGSIGATDDQEWKERLKEKWERAFTSSLHVRKARHDELIEELKDQFLVLQRRVENNNRESELQRLTNAHTIAVREVGKQRAKFRTLAAEIDDLRGKVEGLPPKRRLKVDPYGAPFRQCLQKRASSSELHESLDTLLSRLREEALKNANPSGAEPVRSDDGSSEETLVDRNPCRKRHREDEEVSNEEIGTPSAESRSDRKDSVTDGIGRTNCVASDRPLKRVKRCAAAEVTA